VAKPVATGKKINFRKRGERENQGKKGMRRKGAQNVFRNHEKGGENFSVL